MGLSYDQQIKKLEKELNDLKKKDKIKQKELEKKKKIKDLERQIKQKKYSGIKETGKNLKAIGKNIGKEFEKFIIDKDPNGKPKKFKSVEEVMRDLPQ